MCAFSERLYDEVLTWAKRYDSELEEMFSGMEINFYKLSCSEGKCLVLFYRPKELEEYMNQPKLRELIGQYGYKESNIEEMDASELLGSLQIQRKVVAIVLAAATLLFSDIRRQMCRALLKKKAEILL